MDAFREKTQEHALRKAREDALRKAREDALKVRANRYGKSKQGLENAIS